MKDLIALGVVAVVLLVIVLPALIAGAMSR